MLVFDGATGTSLQNFELGPDDFGGAEYEGCNEILVKTSPGYVEDVHKQFLEAGCDVIETNTFGANSIVLAEYGLEKESFEINKAAGLIAKCIAEKYSTKSQKRFVAGSMGPTTKLPTLGHIDFDTMRQSYEQQASGLIDGKVDMIIIETCQDVLQIKAAIQGVMNAKKHALSDIPIMVSVTIETTGTMLVGTDISAVLTILEPYPIDILGLNCATGPEQMKSYIKYLDQNSPFIISCIPNAGLPENIGGRAHYKLTPLELKMQLMHFIEDLGVRVIGGCCGTTPEHIEKLRELSLSMTIKPRPCRNPHSRAYRTSLYNYVPSLSSIYSTTPYKQDSSFLIIGERLNASGSKKVRELLNKEDWDGLVGIAKNQLKENSHVIDVNVDYVGRNGISDMKELVSRLVTNINLPLMIDSTEATKMESGLKVSGGKSIINSTNYEDGEGRFLEVVDLARKYGCGIVIGTIDEKGMARTTERKFYIAERAYKQATELGMPPHEIFYDPLALPISTGIEEDRRNAIETLNAIKVIKQELKGVHIVLGISNISFGLSPATRITLNSVFLDLCVKAGLDSAIISPSKILPLNKISLEHTQACYDLIHDSRKYNNGICTYDPLTNLTSIFEGISSKTARSSKEKISTLPIEKQLPQHIIDGEREGLDKCLSQALKKYKPLEIINQFLLDGMKVVGELFGSGKMQLPFVLQSAQTMKSAVKYLEPYMDKSGAENVSKGKFLIATVKGDVHDIGKNLVDIILSNNGYEVINLGIKQEISAIINAQKSHNADCIAMSGLLVKSTAFMKDNLEALNREGISVPVILGGAALTPRFVHNDCNSVYNGQVVYGKDAFTDLKFMDSFIKAKQTKEWDDSSGFLNNNINITELGLSQKKSLEINLKNLNDSESPASFKSGTHRSETIRQEVPVKPPFLGPKVLTENDLELKFILPYLDLNALYASQWQMKKTKGMSQDEYNAFISENAEPVLKKWLNEIQENQLLQPSAVYGYFPCGRDGNRLEIFDSTCSSIGCFEFPRQRSGNRYCISDYFADLIENKPVDYLPMQAVTMGSFASEFAKKLFDTDNYSDYLYFHGLAVQLAEALAEYVHSIIRKECGFAHLEPNLLKDILGQRYRGARYSFGYPACPNVADSMKQLEWLEAKKINLFMDESEQIHPEQSTTAIVALHSRAKYFSA
nr:methionine synthase [Prochlorococcus sp. MIT 1341]